MQHRTGQTTFAMRRKGDELPDDEFLEGDEGENFPRFKLVEIEGFKPPITNPVAFLNGFSVAFEVSESEPEEGGRPFGHLDVRVAINDVFDDTVTVKVIYGLRDLSGDWDDEHEAIISFMVLAD